MTKYSDTAKKRGRPRNERRHDEIIAVATELFMSHGLHATTMEHIARQLGVSKLTLYSRFENKDALFAAVIQNKCQEYIPDSFFGDFDKYPLEESLYKIAYGLINLIISDDARNIERLLMAEANKNKNLILTFYKTGPARVKGMIAGHLERLHKKKKLYVPDPVYSTHVFGALIKGSDICFRLMMNIPPKPTKEEIQKYCQQAVHSFIKMHAHE